jgi:NAD(P)-dependent dehydrogenase (short-subunit alcohol dehydrogenase family)
MTLRGKTALVTGASRGLGRALAARLVDEGANVAVVSRNRRDLDAPGTYAIEGDVGDVRDVARMLAETGDRFGPLDILVNNASTLGEAPLPLLADLQPDVLERIWAVNVQGPFRLMKAAAGSMLVRGGGIVVNLSSDAAVNHYPTWGGYAASKAALDHITATFATEMAGTGVRFMAFDPGEMDTGMHADAIPDADRITLLDPDFVAEKLVSWLKEPRGGWRVTVGELS